MCNKLFLTVLPIFIPSTIKNIPRLIMLSDGNSSTEHCSELQNKDIFVSCRAVGIPEPQVVILVNGNIAERFEQRGNNEAVITLPPVQYGEVVMFECQASTMTTTSNIIVNLSYTCKCMSVYSKSDLTK